MTLTGARVANGPIESSRVDLLIRNRRVFIGAPASHRRKLDLRGFLILPGLINAHDHLEFNLLPRLGHGPYKNATAWAEDIYHPNESPLKEHLNVPKKVRLFWGGLKNLLAGATCVAHHNAYEPEVFNHSFPVRVVRRYGWAHSIHFSPDWLTRFRRTSRRHPYIIHLAEGTDEESRRELDEMELAGALAPSTVLVHAVALKSTDVDRIRERKASLIWCPTSNCFTLGRTMCPNLLFSGIPIALGTDSALTADGDLIDELRKACGTVDSVRLYQMVTSGAAKVLRLNSGAGHIRNGGVADLLVVRDYGQKPADSLGDLRPELVFVNGRLSLLSESTVERFRATDLTGYEKVEIEGRGRWRLPFGVSELLSTTEQTIGTKVHLAGKVVIL